MEYVQQLHALLWLLCKFEYQYKQEQYLPDDTMRSGELEKYDFVIQDPMEARKQKLADALKLQQFLRDVEDEEDWIREKEPIASSTNRG